MKLTGLVGAFDTTSSTFGWKTAASASAPFSRRGSTRCFTSRVFTWPTCYGPFARNLILFVFLSSTRLPFHVQINRTCFSFICTFLYLLHFDYVSHSNRLLLTVALITACNAEAAAAVSYSMLFIISNYRLHHSGINNFRSKAETFFRLFCQMKYYSLISIWVLNIFRLHYSVHRKLLLWQILCQLIFFIVKMSKYFVYIYCIT